MKTILNIEEVGKVAIYRNKATGQTNEVSGLNDIGQAWNIARTMANVWGWNIIDLAVSMA